MKQKTSGFTLIELLVVIAIIAILAAILFPVFANAKEHARQAKCLSNLKQLSIAFITYRDDNEGGMPSAGTYLDAENIDWCGCAQCGELVYPRFGALWPYAKSAGIFVCPTDRGREAKCVTGKPRDYALSYSMNWKLHYQKLDSLAPRRLSRLLVLLHEDRDTINDGLFLWDTWNNHDIPDKVHYDGTTAAYADGHAKWVSFDNLVKERDAGYWTTDGSH